MTAALPMYDRPETAAANQRLWDVIRGNLSEMWRDARERGWPLPDRLSQPEDLWSHWLDPDLTLSQSCSLPVRDRLRDRVTLVGTADYGLPDCPPGHYNSVFVVRALGVSSRWAAASMKRIAGSEAASGSAIDPGDSGPSRQSTPLRRCSSPSIVS